MTVLTIDIERINSWRHAQVLNIAAQIAKVPADMRVAKPMPLYVRALFIGGGVALAGAGLYVVSSLAAVGAVGAGANLRTAVIVLCLLFLPALNGDVRRAIASAFNRDPKYTLWPTTTKTRLTERLQHALCIVCEELV